MVRLVRCDRCGEEIKVGSDSFGTAEIPVINRDEVSSDAANKDLCHKCLRDLWTWLGNKRTFIGTN